MTLEEMARMLDLSCVQASSTLEEVRQCVATAKKYNILAIFTLPAHIPFMLEEIGEAPIIPAATVGFPSGGTSTSIKVAESREQLALGCREFDMVNNIAWLKASKYDLYKQDILAVKEAIEGRPLKVILECHYLNDQEIIRACNLAAECGVDFVKTGTGWAPTGATLENVALMKKTVAGRCDVKAAGGVRDLVTLKALHAVGASRFGVGVRTAEALFEASTTTANSSY